MRRGAVFHKAVLKVSWKLVGLCVFLRRLQWWVVFAAVFSVILMKRLSHKDTLISLVGFLFCGGVVQCKVKIVFCMRPFFPFFLFFLSSSSFFKYIFLHFIVKYGAGEGEEFSDKL